MIGHDSIEYASLTDVGIRRSHNQDAHATLLATDSEQWQQRGHIFLVADGMGAHAVGELASQLAVGIIPHTYHKYAPQGSVPALRKAFVEANATIHTKGQQNPEFRGMGTTTTALLLRPEGVWLGHVGDSRAYRIRGEQIEQMTFDHSWVWEMARRQGVDPDGLQNIPSNVIIRSLGPEPLVDVDVEGPHVVKSGDIFLLCSDGLSGQISDSEIGAIASVLPPAEACRVLVDLANLRGGPDNITVLIVRVRDALAQPNSAPEDWSSWLWRVSWPLWSLLLGTALAGYAAFLEYNERVPTLTKGFFALAACAIVAGLTGLAISFRHERRRLAKEPSHARLRIYRRAACHVQRPFVDELAKKLSALEQQIKDKRWGADWKAYEHHLELAENLITKGSLPEAFREYCRALRFLTETVQRESPRGEAFQPLWDARK